MRTIRFPCQAAWKCSALMLALFAIARGAQDPEARHPLFREAYPDNIQSRLDAKEKLLAGRSFIVGQEKSPVSAQFVIKWIRRWPPGSTITVAFSGGSTELRTQIEKEAVEWSKYCNIKFNFRDRGKFREWSKADTDYKADIRIGFDEPGYYWSALGTESIDPERYYCNETSMNFAGFMAKLPDAPYFGAVVKHEFGHALGFEHEHQGPKEGCEDEIRWEDDAGYVPTKDKDGYFIADPQGRHPGAYTVFSAGTDPWDREKVYSNLKRLHNSRAYKSSAFDRNSIMKYYLDPVILTKGEASRCYSPDTTRISRLDRQGAAELYPRSPQRIRQIVNEQKSALTAMLEVENLSAKTKEHYKARIKSLPK
jgi:hypothetical protein